MKHFIVLALASFGTIFSAQAKLNVVATTADLAAIAREIGGDHVDITTLARPAEDPHFIDPKPSFIVKLNRADALVEGGAELEIGWLPPLLQGARNSKLAAGSSGLIRANQGVDMLEVPTELDRSKGDIHAAGNPHYLVDPLNAKIVARNITDCLARLDASSADFYKQNYNRFVTSLDAKLDSWLKKLAPYKGESLASYHNSWPYFARRFGFKLDTFLEPKPGIPPTPAHLAEVILKMKQEGTRAILVDAYLDQRTAETVAARTGAAVVPVTQFPGGIKGTEDGYIAMMDYLVDTTAKALASHK